MQTSDLIKNLQQIDTTVPFDAEVVIGDDWIQNAIISVYHEPPYTFLKVESKIEDDDAACDDECTEEYSEKYDELYHSFLRNTFTLVQNGKLSVDQAIMRTERVMDATRMDGSDTGIEIMALYNKP